VYDDILIPTDGSEEMAAVADHGLAMAEAFDATVHALYVVDHRAYATIPDDSRDRVRDALESDGHAATRAIAERAIDADVDAVREVRWGNPPAAILAYAAENEVDLIVMGTHGRTGYERYLLGSVAEKVVRAATVPVLAVFVGEDVETELAGAVPSGDNEFG
jgi:nucleotide-binding universal stress UspA family protein